MLIGAELSGTSNSLVSLSDLTTNLAKLTLNTSMFKKSKKSSDKVPHTYFIKRKTEPTSLIKGIKYHIKIPSVISPSDSQARCSKPSKQKAWSMSHEIVNCPKNLRSNRKQRIANKQSTEPTE
ncbi:hypothetical protein Tco_0136983, partial [Tanacetum coccineum]